MKRKIEPNACRPPPPGSRLRILVGGVHLDGAGYPNARNTLRVLRDHLGVEVVECGYWLPDELRLWRLVRSSLLRRIGLLFRLSIGNAASLMRVLWSARGTKTAVYVPYPGMFLLWLLSWIPMRLRPATLLDAYVTHWDALVLDRRQLAADSIVSKLFKSAEARAMRTADRVLVDTQANERFVSQTFHLDPQRVRSLPLAIDEAALFVCRSRGPAMEIRENTPLKVLFVGTFIPLHGLAKALRQLAPLLDDHRFEFTLIGDGQESLEVETVLAALSSCNVRWIREWQSPASIAECIQTADVCLGVFGGPGKAARVLPFKIYLYLALGKAVLTQNINSSPGIAPPPPVLGVDPHEPGQIADALLRLRDDPELRGRLGRQAAKYFRQYLSGERLAQEWERLLIELG